MLWEPEEYDRFIESEIDKDGVRGKERWVAQCTDCELEVDFLSRAEADKVVAEHKGMGHRGRLGCWYQLPNGARKDLPFREGL